MERLIFCRFYGCGSEDHEYDWKRIIGEIRRLQPNILIFNMGDPDFRWVGNEDGIAPIPCWNVVDSLEFSIMTEEKEALTDKLWLPAECDVQCEPIGFIAIATSIRSKVWISSWAYTIIR